jgi:hypothetical protein
MFLMAYPPDGWSSQDGRVLFDAERQAERFASNARLAFSLTIATLMLLLSITVGRWNEADSNRWLRHNNVHLRGRSETIDVYAYR